MQEVFKGRSGLEVETAMEPISISHQGIVEPFSKGVLAFRFSRHGLDINTVFQVLEEYEQTLRKKNVHRISFNQVLLDFYERIREVTGEKKAKSAFLIEQWIENGPPVVLFVFGVQPTVLRLLVQNLRYRFDILRAISTEQILHINQAFIAPSLVPSLFSETPFTSVGETLLSERERILLQYQEQTRLIQSGVKGIIKRSQAEKTSIIIHGMHCHPMFLPLSKKKPTRFYYFLGHKDTDLLKKELLETLGTKNKEVVKQKLLIYDAVLEIAKKEERTIIFASTPKEAVKAVINDFITRIKEIELQEKKE